MRNLSAVALVWVSVLGTACSSPSDTSGSGGSTSAASSSSGVKACVPGDQKGCDCIGGSKGAQICKDDGTGYGPCQGCGGGASSSSSSTSSSSSSVSSASSSSSSVSSAS